MVLGRIVFECGKTPKLCSFLGLRWGRLLLCGSKKQTRVMHIFSPSNFYIMYKFIKSALVILLFAGAAAFGPDMQAKPIVHSVQPENVGPITLWQTNPGVLFASWVTFPPGNTSFVVLFNVTTQQPVQQFNTPNNGAIFNNLTSGHTYLVSVAHGQNVRSETIIVF